MVKYSLKLSLTMILWKYNIDYFKHKLTESFSFTSCHFRHLIAGNYGHSEKSVCLFPWGKIKPRQKFPSCLDIEALPENLTDLRSSSRGLCFNIHIKRKALLTCSLQNIYLWIYGMYLKISDVCLMHCSLVTLNHSVFV